MDEESFHSYEKMIFENAMQAFLRHFMEQIMVVLEMDLSLGRQGSSFVEEKHALIEDIQNAVGKMVEIFQSLIGSIRNVDQPIFPTMSGNMYVFSASPKMITAYSQMLNKMAELLGCSKQYAFLLYPAMTDIIYTDVLFKKRNKEGKVIVVTFPERLVENPGVIPILFHEAFHVAERRIRGRKQRAYCYLENVIGQIEEWIFCGVTSLSDRLTEEQEKSVRNNLMDRWFGKVTDDFLNWVGETEEKSRELYAQRLIARVNRIFLQELRSLEFRIYDDLEEELMGVFEKEEKRDPDFENYQKIVEVLHENAAIIRSNILQIIMYDLLSGIGEEHMYIYREGYADIASCLFIGISASDYSDAFRLSCQFEVPDREYMDREKTIRQYVVSKALAAVTGETGWQEKEKECREKIGNWENFPDGAEDETKGISGTILVNSVLLDSYDRYFTGIAEELSEHFEKINELKEFRDSIRDIMSMSDETMMKVFLGAYR